MCTCSVASRATEFRWALIACGLLAVLFIALPQIDLAASGLFYRGAGHWALNREDLWLAIPYRGLPWLGQGLLVALLLLWLGSFIPQLAKLKIEQFGGNKQFTPAFIPADQCSQNCSFVSGHVATASFIMAFGWLGAPAVRRRWLLASMAFGGLFALVRMVPGGHFLSDTIFAWFATYFSLWFTEWLFRRLDWLPD